MAFECPLPGDDYDAITLGHGGGGRLSQRLIEDIIVPALSNDMLNELHDGAVFPDFGGPLAFSTDTFVVRPRVFPGGEAALERARALEGNHEGEGLGGREAVEVAPAD